MYSFDFVTPIDGSPSVLQVVFLGHEDSNDHLAASLEQLVESYNRRLPPSRLLFICPDGVEEKIDQCFKKKSKEIEGRLASASHINVAPYNERGKLVLDSVASLKDSVTDWEITDSFLAEVGNSAAAKIFDETKTILSAPHGYVFRKLSGQEEGIFVRAGNMLREPSCLSVFNYLLLQKLPLDCSVIYIDSFTILSFALSLQSLVGYFRRSVHSVPTPAIVNIHSYKMDPDFRISNEANYLFLISASTSGGLRRKLIEEKQADPKRVVHLLGVGPPSSALSESSVYYREWNPPSFPRPTADQQNTIIEIGTEEFLVSQGPPRPVSITRGHVNTDGAGELYKLYYQGALKFHEPGPKKGGVYSTFSMSTEAEGSESSPIHTWVHNHLVHELPASVHTLVYADDPMSKEISSWICNTLARHVTMKSLTELKDDVGYNVSDSNSVVIVAFFDPDLESLRESSIALRRMGDVHRHYVVGYTFPGSRAEHDRLKNDLRMGRNGPKYGWSEFLVLPVGATPVHESLALHNLPFDTETINEHRVELGDELADALITQGNHLKIPSDGLFLPRTDGNPLCLRHDSVFFSKASVADVSQIAVYAMVSAAMQSAREPKISSNQCSAPTTPGFDENPFVRSVLGPSMFARYSDGILQASLLRSAQRSELDYSASDDLSHSFASICQSIFISCNHEVGDAAFEFMHALATKKISLRKIDSERLLQEIQSNPVLKAFWELLPYERKMLTNNATEATP